MAHWVTLDNGVHVDLDSNSPVAQAVKQHGKEKMNRKYLSDIEVHLDFNKDKFNPKTKAYYDIKKDMQELKKHTAQLEFSDDAYKQIISDMGEYMKGGSKYKDKYK